MFPIPSNIYITHYSSHKCFNIQITNGKPLKKKNDKFKKQNQHGEAPMKMHPAISVSEINLVFLKKVTKSSVPITGLS